MLKVERCVIPSHTTLSLILCIYVCNFLIPRGNKSLFTLQVYIETYKAMRLYMSYENINYKFMASFTLNISRKDELFPVTYYVAPKLQDSQV